MEYYVIEYNKLVKYCRNLEKKYMDLNKETISWQTMIKFAPIIGMISHNNIIIKRNWKYSIYISVNKKNKSFY